MSVIEDLRKQGISVADILLPKKGIDMNKWAVIACDQFSSEREYWQNVSDYVGSEPSALNIIFPECYLEDDDKEQRIRDINSKMNEYLASGIFDTYKDCFVLVERKSADGKKRLGLMVALDLENYSYEKGSKTLIRATEGTIMDRIPPRKAIRKDAPMELPHIMVLINDKNRSIIEALHAKSNELEVLYDFNLMMNSGSVKAWLVNSEEDLKVVRDGFASMLDNLDKDNRLLFAMGDGNHSFATAKSTWEDIKASLSPEERERHPARYCLVELENIFDEGLLFEPIHRVFFDVDPNVFDDALKVVDPNFSKSESKDKESALRAINANDGKVRFATWKNGVFNVYSLDRDRAVSAPKAIQIQIDDIVGKRKIGRIDYTHGTDSTIAIASKGNNFAVLMPDISKDDFFDAILRGGAFPRKTFSIGEASEKRFYIEARLIK